MGNRRSVKMMFNSIYRVFLQTVLSFVRFRKVIKAQLAVIWIIVLMIAFSASFPSTAGGTPRAATTPLCARRSTTSQLLPHAEERGCSLKTSLFQSTRLKVNRNVDYPCGTEQSAPTSAMTSSRPSITSEVERLLPPTDLFAPKHFFFFCCAFATHLPGPGSHHRRET